MFRSASGPGLSINTASANAIGSQTSNPPPSGNTQSKPLFGGSSTPQPQQNSSLFGAKQAPGNTQQGGGTFGGTSSQNQSGGPFGSQSSMQPASSIFGTNNAQQMQPQQMQPQQGGGLFGSLNSNQPPQAGGLFGSTMNNQNKSSMFGTSQAPSQVQQPNNQQPAPVSIFSNSIGQQSQQQQVVPGVRISVNELRPTTRFNDLHEELQKAIEYVDRFIAGQIDFQEQCIGASPGLNELSQQMSPDVQHCTKKLESVQQALEGDAESIAFAKDLVRADAADAKLNFKIINNLKLPPQFHHANLWNSVPAAQHTGPSFPDGVAEQGSSRNLIEYFSKQSDEMSKTLAVYKRNVAEVETYLRGVESNAILEMQRLSVSRNREGGPSTAEDEVKELAIVLRDFESGILGVAAKVGSARETVQSVML